MRDSLLEKKKITVETKQAILSEPPSGGVAVGLASALLLRARTGAQLQPHGVRTAERGRHVGEIRGGTGQPRPRPGPRACRRDRM